MPRRGKSLIPSHSGYCGFSIVCDAEAFAIEGRRGFEESNPYKEFLRADFEHDGQFKTLESIFGAPGISPEATHAPLTRYNFKIRGAKGSDPQALYVKYERILKALYGAGKLDHQVVFVNSDLDGVPCLVCSAFTTHKLHQILQGLGVDFRAKVMAVGVTAPRRSVLVEV